MFAKGVAACQGQRRNFQSFVPQVELLYIAAVMSTNKADNICWRPRISRRTAAPLCHSVFTLWLPTFFIIFPRTIYSSFFFSLLCQREHVRSKVYTAGDVGSGIFLFSLLNSGERPAESLSFAVSLSPCRSVVEQCVLTVRTAVLSHPRMNANPRGTVAVARNDCLLL